MNKKKLITLLFAALVFSLPLAAVFNSSDLGITLHNLRLQLGQDYKKISRAQARMASEYEDQHKKMVDLIKECNELSLVLYSQKQNYTFDLTYALERVTDEYNDFNRDRKPYDRIVGSLDMEIERYARLLEALRRLPPERKEISGVVPDSLRYRNDSLEMHVLLAGTSLNMELAQEALEDTASAPFILDAKGERDRDSCIFYASEMLKMCAERKAILVADSVHYQEAHLRLKESYDYARDRYKFLQNRIFVDGQTPWSQILRRPGRYWKRAVEDSRDKYDFSLIKEDITVENAEEDVDENVTNKIDYTVQFVLIGRRLLTFAVILAFILGLIYLLCRHVPGIRALVAPEQKPFAALLLTCLVWILFHTGMGGDDLQAEAVTLSMTFLWLLSAILAALLIRLKPKELMGSARLYAPTILMALVVIGFRMTFMPNSLMNFVFPPVLILFLVWQLIACIRCRNHVQASDRFIGWTSFAITAVATVMAVMGYIFMALLVLVWWYFQLAAIHTINTIWNLLSRYRATRMEHRIKEYKKNHSAGIAKDEDFFLFGVTWFYDLIRSVIIPILALASIPFCIKLALNVFDFTDLFENVFYKPFINIVGADGSSSLRISFYMLLVCIGLFFVFRYLIQALRSLYVYLNYTLLVRQKNRKTLVRNNEINFALANSVIAILSWLVYIIIIFNLLKIPTGWITMIATGLSAGIGLAMKDILNNFIYGIQLMSGRLRVGDWIDCDGIRGTVTKISYQSTQIETVDGAVMSFLNAELFAKNFSNLTRNNSYEFLKITVGVAYGTDVQKVRELLVEALQVLRTKDKYGREVVRPDKGIYVVLGDLADSSVNIAVKQFVLVAERVGYIDRAKEVIYNALNQGGITIPFPQLDIHVSKDE